MRGDKNFTIHCHHHCCCCLWKCPFSVASLYRKVLNFFFFFFSRYFVLLFFTQYMLLMVAVAVYWYSVRSKGFLPSTNQCKILTHERRTYRRSAFKQATWLNLSFIYDSERGLFFAWIPMNNKTPNGKMCRTIFLMNIVRASTYPMIFSQFKANTTEQKKLCHFQHLINRNIELDNVRLSQACNRHH